MVDSFRGAEHDGPEVSWSVHGVTCVCFFIADDKLREQPIIFCPPFFLSLKLTESERERDLLQCLAQVNFS